MRKDRSLAVVVAALILGVLISQFAVAGRGDSDEVRITNLEQQVEALKKKRKKKAKPGPAGPAGPRGPQGAQGPAGSPAGGMLFGWIEPPDLPAGTSKDFSPLGSGDPGINVGSIPVSPNSTVVLRDLAVRVLSAPGINARWEMTLQGASTTQQLTCTINGAFGNSCNSGSQTATIPPGGSVRLIVADAGASPATPTNLYYSYRVGGP